MRDNPFALRLATGVLAIDISMPREGDTLMLRATMDHVLVGGTKVEETINLLLCLKSDRQPFTLDDYRMGRLGNLEPAVTQLTVGLGSRTNLLLVGENSKHALPIVLWTNDPQRTTAAIKDFAAKRLGENSFTASLASSGLACFVTEGLSPLVTGHRLFTQRTSTVTLATLD